MRNKNNVISRSYVKKLKEEVENKNNNAIKKGWMAACIIFENQLDILNKILEGE